jgi:hypothetical protein
MLTSGAFGYLFDYLIAWLIVLSIVTHTWSFFRTPWWRTHPRLGLVVGNSLVFACLMSVTALTAETYLRFLAVQTDAFGMSLPARRWFVLYTDLNSVGCRDREWAIPKPLGVRRIAFVGDSFTYGWGIDRPQDRFPDLLQAKFDADAPGTVEVMNLAKPGWNTGQHLQFIREMAPRYEIDEVVLCHVVNDIEDLLPRSPTFDPTRPPETAWLNLDSSCLLDYLYRRVLLPRAPSVRGYHDWLASGYSDPALWERQTDRFRAIGRYCSERQIAFRVVLLPLLAVQGSKLQQEALHARIAGFFDSRSVAAVDLFPVLGGHSPPSLMVNSHDSHPNELVHQMFANRIWARLYAPQ